LNINTLGVELNPIRNLLALLGAHHILHISRLRFNVFLIRWKICRLDLFFGIKTASFSLITIQRAKLSRGVLLILACAI